MEQTQEKKKRGPKPKPELIELAVKTYSNLASGTPLLTAEPKTDHADPSPRESILMQWIAESVPCSYAKFVYPVPPAAPPVKSEPVYEIKIEGDGKYKVDKIWYGPHGLIWEYKGRIQVTDAVQYARFIENVQK